MNEVTDAQKRRAVNIIWNSAKDYSFQPDFKAYDSEGRAELYWNCIIGAVRRHYDYPKLESIFLSFQQYEDSDVYEGLLWLGLESCVYEKELAERPALRSLRVSYARRVTAAGRPGDETDFYGLMAWAHFSRVLGTEPELNAYDKKLLDDMEFPAEATTDDIAQRAKALFQRWFQISTELKKKKKKQRRFHLAPERKRAGGKTRYRRFGLGFADHPKNVYGGSEAGGQENDRAPLTKMSDSQLREFMETKYGRPIYSKKQTEELEKLLCTGNHQDCHLHFTRGEPVKGKIQNGFEALQKTNEAKQIEKNRQYYQMNLTRNRTSIAKLTGRLQNSILLHLQPAPVKANTGRLNGGAVWRAVLLNDSRVFIRDEQDNMGDLSVDILLDASTSQKNRQELVSSQGYIIAESLTKCGIPCRVMSFCSMTGYTMVHIFRDYNEISRNGRIFEYVSNGCNRDGLAIRAVHHLMNGSLYEHKILIILSDVKPNDVRKMRGSGENEFIPYETEASLADTALEVRRARADGIAAVCVFTGDDEDVPSAREVYGQDFARIHSMDQLADTVGILIQNQIKNI